MTNSAEMYLNNIMLLNLLLWLINVYIKVSGSIVPDLSICVASVRYDVQSVYTITEPEW